MPTHLAAKTLPRNWSAQVKSTFVRVVSLAHRALTVSRSWCADSRNARVRLAARADQAASENALLREELRIKDARMVRIDPKRRPQYAPQDRLAILALRAARGWNLAQTARAFQLTAETIASWTRRLDEDGEQALLRMAVPVNRFPDYLAALIQQLKVLCPFMGRRRIANMLARAALHMSPSTVRNHLRRSLPPASPEESKGPATAKSSGRTVTARHPGHVYNCDLTTVPTAGGFWVPWLPQSMLPLWPFCFWILVVLDHFSRRAITTKVFKKEPTSAEVCAALDNVADDCGAPKYTVTDQGRQFQSEFRAWCARRGVKPRFGAVGKHGSIALTERFIRTLKSEGVRQLLMPLSLEAFARELHCFTAWYNEHRPHEALDGATPNEIYHGLPQARDGPVWEPRKRYPRGKRQLLARRRTRLSLDVRAFERRKHLPIVELKRAA